MPTDNVEPCSMQMCTYAVYYVVNFNLVCRLWVTQYYPHSARYGLKYFTLFFPILFNPFG